MHSGGFAHVVENPNHSQDGCGIDPLAQRFVVKTYVATGDGDFQLLASLSDAIDGLRELPHDVRFLGISEIDAVGCPPGSSSRARHLARSLGDGMHRAQPRIEITPAAVAIERHGKSALRLARVWILNANHTCITPAWRLD